MFSLVSFTAIWRNRRQARHARVGLLETGSVCAGEYGEYSEEYFPQSGLPEDYDPATVHDLSYDDALLDARVRHFMSEEYGRVEPPQGMFQRLVKRLNPVQVSQVRTPLFTSLLSGVYGVISGQTLSRLVPGGIAVAIMVVVGLGSGTSSMLRSEQLLVGVESTPVAAQSAGTSYASSPGRGQQPLAQGTGQSTLDVTGGEEAYVVLRGSISLNLPLLNRTTRHLEIPEYNRFSLDPF